MGQLSAKDLERILDVLPVVYADADADQFGRVAIEAVSRLIPHDIVSYNEVHLRDRQVRGLADPPETLWSADAPAIFDSHFDEHPYIRAVGETGDDTARRMSDLLSTRDFHRLGLYAEFYREIGVEYQMAAGFAHRPGVMVGVSADRGPGRDFSDRDVRVLDVLRPHLAVAYRNAMATKSSVPIAQVLDALDEAVVVCNALGRPEVVTERAASLFASYLPTTAADRVPEDVVGWAATIAARLMRNAADDDVPGAVRPLLLSGPAGRIVLRASVAAPGDRIVIRIHDLGPSAGLDVLSPRELEVLQHVADGLTDDEIARLLAVSVRTVSKHLERVYRKLGVSSRGRAVKALGLVPALTNPAGTPESGQAR